MSGQSPPGLGSNITRLFGEEGGKVKGLEFTACDHQEEEIQRSRNELITGGSESRARLLICCSFCLEKIG